jgi:hypothetical protein
MATLVLSTLGYITSGPIGSAIGAVIGQQIDQNLLFRPKPRKGPRLGDLSVQTSSYGAEIPRIFGTMRVAGTVIWATDLTEHKSTSGGKGQPRVTTYAYSASFAVALSARPVMAVGRIWADGKLLRGAGGDFKSATLFRLHRGQEDQAADPLIIAAEGADEAPAYRGIAYAVFENMSLEDFGNRIPSLTFEVVADSSAVPIGAMAVELTGGIVAAGTTPALTGYAAAGDSVRAALEGLADVVPLSLLKDGEAQRLYATTEDALPVPPAAMSQPLEIVRRGQDTVPGEATIIYYDAARDYQTGLQRAIRGSGRIVDRRALPAVLDAGGARALADYRLASLWAGRVSAKAVLDWSCATIRPGSQVLIEGYPGHWRVGRWTLGAMTTTLDLVRVTGAGPPDIAASPGRAVGEPDLPLGPTIVRLLDLPLGDGTETKPLLYVAAAGENEGWRRAALTASFDAGVSWREMGNTAAPAIIGVTMNALPAAGAALLDTVASLEVELVHDGMWLEGRSDAALVGGANLAAVGEELIQFGSVTALGDRRFRLSRLLRGRRGTEWAAEGHLADEPFTLLLREALTTIEGPEGAEARVLASGVGDVPDAAAASKTVGAEMLRPPSPVHLKATESTGGDLAISWIRRSRLGWAWTDGVDTPLGEEAERYRLTISGPGFSRIVETAASAYLYTATARTADGAGPLTLSVVQTGSFAASRPARLILD